MSGSRSTFSNLVLSVLLQIVAAQPVSIWHVSIWTGPAPSSENGPPLSASATRDLSVLPREIAGIVGSYVLVVLLLLGCLLTVGRRLRHSAQTSSRTLEMEMVKPSSRATPSTVLSPTSTKGHWDSPANGTRSKTWGSSRKGVLTMSSPDGSKGHASRPSQDGSLVTIDESVVKADRQKAQDEMERLYEAVMEHDAKQSLGGYDPNDDGGSSPKSPSEGPPEFRHLRHVQLSQRPQQQPSDSFQEDSTSKQAPKSPLSSRLSRLSNLSFFSLRSNSSSSNKPHRGTSVRHLTISPPMGSPELGGRGYPDNEPLSPRRYSPGPPPLLPHQTDGPTSSPPPGSSSRAPPPAPLSIRAASSSSSLPFRAFSQPQSAPSTRTTIVERRESRLRPGGPRTGIPQTPYSPYMPFTPLTPLTPSRVITRRERKQMAKENGTRVLREEDLVPSGDDMWGTDSQI